MTSEAVLPACVGPTMSNELAASIVTRGPKDSPL
jgi:hypothetical protein